MSAFLKKVAALQRMIQKYEALLQRVEDTSQYQNYVADLSVLKQILREVRAGKPVTPVAETTSPTTNTTETTPPPPTAETPTAPTTSNTTAPVNSNITDSVGAGGANKQEDVRVIQHLLELPVTGTVDNATISAIKKFQFSLGMRNPDGRVDAGGGTWRALSGGNVAVINEQEMAELVNAPKTEALLASVHQSEGGYVDDPQDPGGKTKFGIAEHGEWPVFAAMFGLNASNPSLIRNITEDQADEYYIRTRFVALSITDIKSSKVSNALFDQSILTPGIVKRSMRRALNDVDGANNFPTNSNEGFTSEEVAAINKADENKLVNEFVKYQDRYYVSLNNARFERGWLNRTARLKGFVGPTEETNTDTNSGSGNTDTNTNTGTDDTTTPTTSKTLSASVGDGGVNKYEDVVLVQELLNAKGASLTVDGDAGNKTIQAIKDFQKNKLNFRRPDGLISVGGQTWTGLSAGGTTTTTDGNDDTTTGGNDDTTSGGGDDTTTTPTPATNKTLSASVGAGGVNKYEDVALVQELLNAKGASLTVDGDAGNKTVQAIKGFQKNELNFRRPDGLISVGGQTWAGLSGQPQAPANQTGGSDEGDTSGDTYVHPNWQSVNIRYGARAVRLNAKADKLMKSVLAAAGVSGALLTSTLRTYHDQARITKTQTLPNRGAGTVAQWYGQDVLDACRRYNIADFAAWWEARDKRRGRVSSRHLSGWAMDVVPDNNRGGFVRKVRELVNTSGTGVRRLIAKGEMNEPVDHVEFMFEVCR